MQNETNFCPLRYIRPAKSSLSLYLSVVVYLLTHSFKPFMAVPFPRILDLIGDHLELAFSGSLSHWWPSFQYLFQPNPNVGRGYNLNALCVHRDAKLLEGNCTTMSRMALQTRSSSSAPLVILDCTFWPLPGSSQSIKSALPSRRDKQAKYYLRVISAQLPSPTCIQQFAHCFPLWNFFSTIRYKNISLKRRCIYLNLNTVNDGWSQILFCFNGKDI